MRKLVVFLILSFLFISPAFAEDDFQYWSWYDIKLIDTEYVDFINHSQLRFFDDSSDFSLWFTSQRLRFDFFKHLGFGLNHTYIENEVNRTTSKKQFKYQHRLELEINPRWTLNNFLKIKNRNRFEFRWIEDRGSNNTRFRHRWHLEVPIKQVESIKSIYANNEFFVDFKSREINENRAVPLGISFTTSEKTGFSIFYMIQSKKGSKDWSSNQVLGTKISLSL